MNKLFKQDYERFTPPHLQFNTLSYQIAQKSRIEIHLLGA